MVDELPKHIGGYQKLEPWVAVEHGDIRVAWGMPVDFVFGEDIGAKVQEVEARFADIRIYRKMPVPKNHCELETQTETKP